MPRMAALHLLYTLASKLNFSSSVMRFRPPHISISAPTLTFLNSLTFLTFLTFLTTFSACRKSEYLNLSEETITDQGAGIGTVTWTSDKTYILNGLVYVNEGQILSIEAGTVIRARRGQGALASALIISRGGTIIAEGRKSNPIIFTVEGDDLHNSVPLKARGLWGGLIILGNATINTESGEDLIEGIPVSEPRGIYGGNDDDDNSGVLRYVSIRHGGTAIGEGNEINGLTLGGVGRQTIIDHVEVISNADDGIEFFGGNVNCNNLLVAFCGDDAFDLDQGYHGKGQFWLAINDTDSDKCAEINGGLQPVSSLPENMPVIYNATFIGNSGNTETSTIDYRSYGGGYFRNSIVLHPGLGISLSYNNNPDDTYRLFQSGKLAIENSILYPGNDPVPSLYAFSDLDLDLSGKNRVLADSFVVWGNSFENPEISASGSYSLLPVSPEFENLAPYYNSWFQSVPYKGAFGSDNWIGGWTLLSESGIVTN